MFPSLTKLNEITGKYQVNIANMSNGDKKKLEEVGIVPKHGKNKINAKGESDPKPEWGWYIVAKSNRPPRVTNGDLTEMAPEEIDRIGTDSKGTVVINAYEWDHKPSGKSGVGCGLNILQVSTMVHRKDGTDLLTPVVSE